MAECDIEENMNQIKKTYHLINKDGEQFESSIPGLFGGHRGLKIYGRLDCPSALRYIAKGQYVKYRVFFPDEETAVAAGYRPCAKCMPEEYKKWKAREEQKRQPIYYVANNCVPYDCMGSKLKIIKCDNLNEAISQYRQQFSDKKASLANLIDVLYSDYELQQAELENSILNIVGTVSLFSFHRDLLQIPELRGIEYNSWFNDYTDLIYKGRTSMFVALVSELCLNVICSYDYEFSLPGNNDDNFINLERNCHESIEKLGGTFANNPV